MSRLHELGYRLVAGRSEGDRGRYYVGHGGNHHHTGALTLGLRVISSALDVTLPSLCSRMSPLVEGSLSLADARLIEAAGWLESAAPAQDDCPLFDEGW